MASLFEMREQDIIRDPWGTITEGFEVEIKDGVNPTVYEYALPFDIDVFEGSWLADWNGANKLDKVNSCCIPPGDPPVGALAQPASVDDVIIYVSPTTFDYVWSSCIIKLGSKEYRVGKVTNDDKDNGHIHLMDAIEEELPSGTTTIHIRYPMSINKPVRPGCECSVGRASTHVRGLPAGMILRIIVNHHDTPIEDEIIYFELTYKVGKPV